MTEAFFDRLVRRTDRVDSVLSVGLDPDPERLPADAGEYDLPRWAFTRRVIDATHEYAAAFTADVAFYDDADGRRALRETAAYAAGKGVPFVLDARRADTGSGARRAAAVLEWADAVTVSPYLGRDALAPYLDRPDAGVFVLCRTGNSGAADLQDLDLASGEPVYERVAALADLWNEHGNVGLVMGADPDALEAVRESVDLPFLVSGVDPRTDDIEAAVEHGLTTRDGVDLGLVNVSRPVLFAGADRARGLDEYATAAGQAAKRLSRELNGYPEG